MGEYYLNTIFNQVFITIILNAGWKLFGFKNGYSEVPVLTPFKIIGFEIIFAK